MQNFWADKAQSFSNIQQESRKLIVHPALATLIDQQPGVCILDYGCGDGSCIQLLQEHCEVHLYDINETGLEQAKKKLVDYDPLVYKDPSSIPSSYYDYVINSLVLMTLPTKEVITAMLQQIHAALKVNGTALFAITHPCFRSEKFSTFQTAFTKGKSFNYFEEGQPFEVEITDPQTKETVHFNDYHWTLSTVLNLLHSCHLPVQQMFELTDKSLDGYANASASPYIIISCKKN